MKPPLRQSEIFGYFSLLSNDIRDAVQALEIYRNKDVVEKAFDNLKERLNLRRLAVSSEQQSLDGKFFVQFIALYLSYVTKKMLQNKLFKSQTMQEVLEKLDGVEYFEAPGRRLQVGEAIKKHLMELYTKLGGQASRLVTITREFRVQGERSLFCIAFT